MPDFMEIVKNRRSIRKYEEKDIPEAVLNQILDAVKWSPSWTNCQCWELVVVRDQAVKEKLQATVVKGNPAFKSVAAAPVVIALCGKKGVSGYYNKEVSTKFGDWILFDLGIATQTLCLAAHSQGLGTVVVGLMDHDAAAKVLGVPEEHELVALIPVGYPAKSPSAPGRREVSEFTHYDRF